MCCFPGTARATTKAASDANGITACSRSVERSDTTGYDRQTNRIPAGIAARRSYSQSGLPRPPGWRIHQSSPGAFATLDPRLHALMPSAYWSHRCGAYRKRIMEATRSRYAKATLQLAKEDLSARLGVGFPGEVNREWKRINANRGNR